MCFTRFAASREPQGPESYVFYESRRPSRPDSCVSYESCSPWGGKGPRRMHWLRLSSVLSYAMGGPENSRGHSPTYCTSPQGFSYAVGVPRKPQGPQSYVFYGPRRSPGPESYAAGEPGEPQGAHPPDFTSSEGFSYAVGEPRKLQGLEPYVFYESTRPSGPESYVFYEVCNLWGALGARVLCIL